MIVGCIADLFKIVASKDGEVTLRDPFDENEIWNKKVLRRSSEWITFQLLATETLNGKWDWLDFILN